VVATRPVDRSPQPIGKRCSRHCRRRAAGLLWLQGQIPETDGRPEGRHRQGESQT